MNMFKKVKVKKEDISKVLNEPIEEENIFDSLARDEESRLEETEESLEKNKIIEKFFLRRVIFIGNCNFRRNFSLI
mgnify:CR=1 FL=1